MARYYKLLMQANDTLVTHNAFRLSRQLDSLNISPGTTKSLYKTLKLRYLLELSTKPHGKKTKPSKPTFEKTYKLVRFIDHVLLQVHQSSLSRKKMDPLDSALIIKLSTVLQYPTSTPYHSSVSYSTRLGQVNGSPG